MEKEYRARLAMRFSPHLAFSKLSEAELMQ